jgi:hypothetical protein
MHLEERELVPVATLEGDTTVMHGEEPAAAEAQRIAPFKRNNIASLMDGFDDASHVSSRKLSLEHGPDRVAALNWILCYLMVHSILMVEVGQAIRIDCVKLFDPTFDNLAW